MMQIGFEVFEHSSMIGGRKRLVMEIAGECRIYIRMRLDE
jgi:hypothetical protein